MGGKISKYQKDRIGDKKGDISEGRFERAQKGVKKSLSKVIFKSLEA